MRQAVVTENQKVIPSLHIVSEIAPSHSTEPLMALLATISDLFARWIADLSAANNDESCELHKVQLGGNRLADASSS
jgi:hypothetical protein